MTSSDPVPTFSHVPPPPYCPRDEFTPTSSGVTSPSEAQDPNGPSHDYSAYEQVSPEDSDDAPPDEPLPSYEPRSRSAHLDVTLELSGYPYYNHNAVRITESRVPAPQRTSSAPAVATSSMARTASSSPACTRESSHSNHGLSALQRLIDVARQLSDRSAEQVARSIPSSFIVRRTHSNRTSTTHSSSSCSASPVEDPLSGADFRVLDDLDLSTLRTSIANLMRDPRNKDEILQAVNQLRDDLNNRRDRTALKQQVKDFQAEVYANRKKVKAMRKEAKEAQKAAIKEVRLERRAERRARKSGLIA